jgi:hypothetical protein
MAYRYTRTLTIDHTLVPSTLTDFPVLVSGTYSSLATVGNGGRVEHASGYDIAFYSDSALTTKLKHEVEVYTAASGLILMWVKVPSVSSSVDTVIYLAYGDASISATQAEPTNVWTDYRAVWHLTGTMTADSTSNANNLTNVNTVTVSTSGKIGSGAVTAVSGSKYFTGGTGSSLCPSALTFSAWVKASALSQAYNSVVARERFGNGPSYTFLIKSNGKLALYTEDSAGTDINYDGSGLHTLSTGTWYHVALTYAGGDSMRGFVNGVEDKAVTGTANGFSSPTAETFYLGSSSFTPRVFDGLIDEARICSSVRSANWLLAEYRNQNSPGTFYAVGSEVVRFKAAWARNANSLIQ